MKKKVLSINLGNLGSTGSIMHGITENARRFGYEALEAYPDRFDNRPILDDDIIIISDFWRRVYEKLAYYTGFNGCFSVVPTFRFLHKINKIKPDIIHFHNLHNSYINLPLLFRYVKRNDISVVWTLHDCWSFTGKCPHFTISECDKWLTGCYDCKALANYPKSKYDTSKLMYSLKKKWFTGIKDLTIVTPSQWLADLVGQSYLKEYPTQVINNGINLDIFKPIESDFRSRYNIEDKFIILGVSFSWGKSKGLDVFIELAKRLDSKYQIILVGTDDETVNLLPDNIISIKKTQNQQELAEIYTAANVFVNPTREDTFPTVNIESLACGTPVITFKTGGSPEIIDKKTGIVVDYNDTDAMCREIINICEKASFDSLECINRSQKFDAGKCFINYVDLYNKISN